MPELPVVHVSTYAVLETAVAAWKRSAVVALDTEFVRERTFFARLGLIQVCDGSATYLVDPLAVGDLAPLTEILRDREVLKVLHSASEDIEVLWHAVGAVPEPVLDTQIAAGIAGLGPALGYQKLVLAVLGVELFKGETRTDWLARPLSPAQLSYAVEDVTCLLAAHHALRQRLEELGRFEWALEDSGETLDTERFAERPLEAYLRIRAASRLPPRQLAVLQALAAWRDGEARRRDLPRGFVVKDEALVGLAVRQPKEQEDLLRVPAVESRQAARDGAIWLDIIRRAGELPAEEHPPTAVPALTTPLARDLERRLREAARKRADDLGVAPEVLVTRRPLETLVRSALLPGELRLPEALEGWRRPVIGEELLDIARHATAHRGDL